MRRLVVGLVAALAVSLPVAAAADPINPGSGDCTDTDSSGCIYDPVSDDSDPASIIIPFALLAIAVGVGTTWYKISIAKDIARRAGLDERDAAAAAFLSNDGVAATYVAASLKGGNATALTPTPKTAEQRLAELQRLLDKKLITQGEYDSRRTAILDDV